MGTRQQNDRCLLIYRTGQLGDTLVSLPAIRAIKAAHPQHALVLLTDRHPGQNLVSSWDVFEATGLFSQVIFYTPARGSLRGWLLVLGVARRLRQLRPEAVFYMRDPRWNHLRRDRWFFQRLCRIEKFHGVSPVDFTFGERDESGCLQRLPSETDRLLALIRAAGVPVADGEGRPIGLPARASEEARVNAFWREADIPADALVIALGPGSKMPAKQWPLERFEAVGRQLLASHPTCWLLVVGGSDDDPLATRLVRALGDRVANAAGRLNVLEAAEALRRCRLYVGNDTGVMHLAAAVGTPCVAIFSARDHPGRWDPYGQGHIVLRHDPSCAGCLLQVCVEQDMICLKHIQVDDVLGAVEQALSRVSAASGHDGVRTVRWD